jgi:hypothetical protein
MADRNLQTDPPVSLPKVPLSPEELIAMGAEKMSDYLAPETVLTDHEVVEFMLELFDNPTAIEALDREMQGRSGGRSADRWH